MKRPSFQFYPGDWQANSNLRRCSHAEKGVWLDVMCLMHDQPEYGILRWSLKEVAQAVGCSISLLKGLISKGVLKGDDKSLTEPFIYTPRSGRRDGQPVTLVGTEDGPIWYSSRMVKDEYVRTIRGESTRFGADMGDAPIPPFGDGTSSPSSSSSPTSVSSVPNGTGGKPPMLTDPKEIIFGYGLSMLVNAGTPEKQARSFLGGLAKHHGEPELIDKLRECAKARPLQPLEWLAAALPPTGPKPKLNKQEALEASNREVARRFIEKLESEHEQE